MWNTALIAACRCGVASGGDAAGHGRGDDGQPCDGVGGYDGVPVERRREEAAHPDGTHRQVQPRRHCFHLCICSNGATESIRAILFALRSSMH